MEEVDLVVVGGGPAGSSAAEAALKADSNLRVVLLEKRARPHGTCAGGVGVSWLTQIGIQRLPSHLIESKTTCVKINGPTESASIRAKDVGEDALGYVIDRWGFDQWLLSKAEAAGAQVLRETAFKSIARESGGWVVQAQRGDGESFGVKGKYVVDASGPAAVVAKQLGLRINEKPEDIHTGLQYTIRTEDSKVSPDTMELWFKRDPTPEAPWGCRSGYIWSFPSSHPYWGCDRLGMKGSYTRLGVGVDQEMNRTPGRKAKECLDAFIKCHSEFQGEVVDENGGLIPTGNVLDTAFENVFVVGDSGRHVSPLHGGGILAASVAGQEAGRAAALGSSMKQFEAAWRARIGFLLDSHYAGKQILRSLDDDDIDTMVRELGKFKLESVDPVREIPRALAFMVKNPRLAGKATVKGFLGMLTAKAGIA